MEYLWVPFIAAAAVFPHCLGMCGGFVLHLSGGASRWATMGRLLLWSLGKTTTYVFLGAMAGLAGERIIDLAQTPWIQDALAYGAGGIMILMGLSVLGLLPKRIASNSTSSTAEQREGLFASLMGSLICRPSASAALVMGMAAGFLPCPIVIAFLAWSVHLGSVGMGMAVMAAVGVGTSWSLLALGMTGQMVRAPLRRWAAPIGAMLLMVAGGATMLRGTQIFHQVLGCPHQTLGQVLPPAQPDDASASGQNGTSANGRH